MAGVRGNNMKKGLSALVIVVALIAGAIGSGIGKEFAKGFFSSVEPSEAEIRETLAEGFRQAANQINENAPIMVDEETRMDKATVGPGAVFTYHYTFPNYSADQLDKGFILNDLRKNVTANVCNSKEMEGSLKLGGRYVYSYSGANGIHIAEFGISGGNCGYKVKLP